MKKTILFGLLVVITGSLAAGTASAQIQWTPEQKAVWKTETTIGNLIVRGDLQGFLSYFDDDFENWPPGSPTPVPKNVMEKGMKYRISQGRKVVHYGLIPRIIWVNGNYAYVQDYSTMVLENKKGKKLRLSGFNLDVFIKKGGRWLMVASMTMSDNSKK